MRSRRQSLHLLRGCNGRRGVLGVQIDCKMISTFVCSSTIYMKKVTSNW
jgi:hypothetical protein